MNETDFWEAVDPFMKQDGIITNEDLQLALGLPEKEANEVAACFCEEGKLFRLVTRHSWGYGRIDPGEEVFPLIQRCAGVIPRKRKPRGSE